MISWWQKKYRHGCVVEKTEHSTESKALDQLLYADDMQDVSNGVIHLVRWDSSCVIHLETKLAHEFFHETQRLLSLSKSKERRFYGQCAVDQ